MKELFIYETLRWKDNPDLSDYEAEEYAFVFRC